jgi:predicted transcriptional regulator
MSNREIVIDLLSKLPENASLGEIAREIEFLAGIKEGREQVRRGEGIPVEEARKLVDTWAAG